MKLDKTIHKFHEYQMYMGHINEHDYVTLHWVVWVEHQWTLNGDDGIYYGGVDFVESFNEIQR